MKLRVFLVLILIVPFAHAQQSFSFSKSKKELVKLYQTLPEATTFYCGCDIKWTGKKGSPIPESCGYTPRNAVTRKGNPNKRATRIEWEHVVASWHFGHQLQCWQNGGRKNCSKNSQVFKRMEADMHNLVPAVGELNADRSNFKYGMIEGEPRSYGACDFEVNFKGKRAEPSPSVRGDIARKYFYMSDQYGFRISKQQLKLFEAWSRADPVDEWECKRNKLIEGVQGNTNRFVMDECQEKAREH